MGAYLNAEALLDLYLTEPNPPLVLDLSGGEPELVPEWCLWVLEEVESRGLRDQIFIWLDDNLSDWHMGHYLTEPEIAYMAGFPRHSRVGCFKGFSKRSFSFNTGAHSSLYDRQFKIFHKLVGAGFDMYAYATFTTPTMERMEIDMADFVDRLQDVHEKLPLRTVPLRIRTFSANTVRSRHAHEQAMDLQFHAAAIWEDELLKRFSSRELGLRLEDVDLQR